MVALNLCPLRQKVEAERSLCYSDEFADQQASLLGIVHLPAPVG
jgi:hypothetical protein